MFCSDPSANLQDTPSWLFDGWATLIVTLSILAGVFSGEPRLTAHAAVRDCLCNEFGAYRMHLVIHIGLVKWCLQLRAWLQEEPARVGSSTATSTSAGDVARFKWPKWPMVSEKSTILAGCDCITVACQWSSEE